MNEGDDHDACSSLQILSCHLTVSSKNPMTRLISAAEDIIFMIAPSSKPLFEGHCPGVILTKSLHYPIVLYI